MSATYFRPTTEVDEEWYIGSYPMVQRELSEAAATSARSHYFEIGEARGYLRAPGACRFERIPSNRFKGLWIDGANAEALLDERIERGQLQSNAYQKYADLIFKGYCVLEALVPEEVVDAAAAEHDAIFHGADERAAFSGRGAGSDGRWSDRVLTHPAKALDTYMHSRPIRNLVLHENIVGFLRGLFGEGVLASQSLGFWRGSQQALHQDFAFVTYCHPLQFVGVWMALEDIVPNSGELVYAVASHKLQHYLFNGELSVHEARRLSHVAPDSVATEKKRYEAWVKETVASKKLTLERFHARKGDALIWHAALMHGGTRVSAEHTRKSIVTHFCPMSRVPTYFERRQSYLLNAHAPDVYYASAHHRIAY